MDTRATTVRFPVDLHDAISATLGYSDSLNGWVLDACRERLARKSPAPTPDPHPEPERTKVRKPASPAPAEAGKDVSPRFGSKVKPA